jgi:ABC-type bacteriocin/lantibiotic exporter with double-glycine peptidase domain
MNFTYAIILILILNGLTQAASTNDDSRCGSFCLTVALKSLDLKTSIEAVEGNLGEMSSTGYSMDQLRKTADSFGFSTTVSVTNLENLQWRKEHFNERFICLTLIRDNHFVLLTDIKAATVSICDPPNLNILDIPVFDRIWSGNVLLISKNPLASEEDIVKSRNRLRFARLAVFGFIIILASAILSVASQRLVAKRGLR